MENKMPTKFKQFLKIAALVAMFYMIGFLFIVTLLTIGQPQ